MPPGRIVSPLILLALVGCSQSAPPAKPPATSQLRPAGQVNVHLMDSTGLQMLIDSYRGRVVVVDYWATDCPPCIRELPNLGRLQRELPDDQFQGITVCLDYIGLENRPPASYQVGAVQILEKVDAGQLDNVLSTDDVDQVLNRIGVLAPPAVLVFDRQGKLAGKFEGAQHDGERSTYEEVERLARRLVGTGNAGDGN